MSKRGIACPCLFQKLLPDMEHAEDASPFREAELIIDLFHFTFSPPSSTMVRQQSSAAGVLALLQEPDIVFKRHALKALNPLVPQFWAEISEHIALMSGFRSSRLSLFIC